MRSKNKILSVALPVVIVTMYGLLSGAIKIQNDTTAVTELVYNNLYANVENPEYSVMQGNCTDGTYAYFVMENNAVTDSICEIVKLRISDWSIVKVATDIDINHGNDLTYNSKINKIIAVHNKPNYNTLSIINPDTLKVESDVTLPCKVYSIAYNEAKDQYVVGISGNSDFQILNSDFKVKNIYTGIESEYVHQGMDCDEKYIYFIQNASNNSDNIILVYDWNGKYIKTINVNVAMEGEGLFHIGSTFYAGFHSSTYRGTVYKMILPLD